MSALRNVEDTIGGFVERVFGRLFRGHVEPVELARKLAREMEDHKTVSVTRVYVPNEYVVYLSPADRNRFASFEGSLTTELGVYLTERARHEGFTLLSNPVVTLDTDTDLRVGEYGIACRVVDPPVEAPEEVDAASPELPPDLSRISVAQAPPVDEASVEAPQPDGAVNDDAVAFPEPADDAPEGVVADELPAVGVAPPEPALDAAPEAQVDAAPVPVVEAPEEGPAEPVLAGAPPDDDEPIAPAVAEPVLAGPPPEPVAADPEPVVDIAPDPDPEPIPLPEPVASIPAEPEPEPVPEPVAHIEPAAPPAVPAPPVATPLPPPGGYEPLAGVSGTQILSAADARAEGLVQEEMSLVVAGRRHAITKRATTIGRSRECDIVVQDSNASRMHAEIRHIGLDYFIVDSNSTNGTLVNGQRVRRHALANGDRILIGTTEIVVEHTT